MNVLKNCAKYVTLLIVAVASWPTFANTEPGPDLLRMFASLIVVLAVIFLLAFVVNKLKITPNSQKNLRCVAHLSLGQKERVIIVEVNNQQFMLGVTAHNINLLHSLEEPVAQPSRDNPMQESQLMATLKSILSKEKHD